MPKILHFPLPLKYSAAPCLDMTKVLAHVVAGVMLFPRQKDEKNLHSYISLGINDAYTSALADGMPQQEAFASLLQVVTQLFGDTQYFGTSLEGDERQGAPTTAADYQEIPIPQHNAAAWAIYQRSLCEASFTASGSGSIAVRYIRGRMAGMLASFVLHSNLSLNKAAVEVEKLWPGARKDLPGWMHNLLPAMNARNFVENIWRDFKSVAHFWAALQDFYLDDQLLEEDSIVLDLSAISELDPILMPRTDGDGFESVPMTQWPSQDTGIRALIFKADHILAESEKRGRLKQSTTNIIPSKDCWRIILTC